MYFWRLLTEQMVSTLLQVDLGDETRVTKGQARLAVTQAERDLRFANCVLSAGNWINFEILHFKCKTDKQTEIVEQNDNGKQVVLVKYWCSRQDQIRKWLFLK